MFIIIWSTFRLGSEPCFEKSEKRRGCVIFPLQKYPRGSWETQWALICPGIILLVQGGFLLRFWYFLRIHLPFFPLSIHLTQRRRCSIESLQPALFIFIFQMWRYDKLFCHQCKGYKVCHVATLMQHLDQCMLTPKALLSATSPIDCCPKKWAIYNSKVARMSRRRVILSAELRSDHSPLLSRRGTTRTRTRTRWATQITLISLPKRNIQDQDQQPRSLLSPLPKRNNQDNFAALLKFLPEVLQSCPGCSSYIRTFESVEDA